MAGSVKPTSLANREASVTYNYQNLYDQAENLFNESLTANTTAKSLIPGTVINTTPTRGMTFWQGTGQYLDVTFPEPVRVHGITHASYLAYRAALDVFDGTGGVEGALVKTTAEAPATQSWYAMCELPAGRYRFKWKSGGTGGGLILAEWFIEYSPETYHLLEDVDTGEFFGWNGSSFVALGTTPPTDAATYTANGFKAVSGVPLGSFAASHARFRFRRYSPEAGVTDALILTAVPATQRLVQTGDLDFRHASTIDLVTAAVATSGAGAVRFAVSVDRGASWKAYGGGAWADLGASPSAAAVLAQGMSAATMGALLSADWMSLFGGKPGTIRFMIALDIAATSDVAQVDKVSIRADLEGAYQLATPGTDYLLKLYPAAAAVRAQAANTLKIVYPV